MIEVIMKKSSEQNTSDLIAIVPFRKNSKGLKEKNFMSIQGKPLWLRAVNQALRTLDSVLLSTDYTALDTKNIKGDVIFDRRPDFLALDETNMDSVIKYLIERYHLENKIILLLQPTSPLRSDRDIAQALKLFHKKEHTCVISVTEVENSVLKYGMVKENTFLPINNPQFCFENRQKLPLVYRPNGAIFIFSAADFLVHNKIPCSNIGHVAMPANRSIDIDTLEDLYLAKNNLADFGELY